MNIPINFREKTLNINGRMFRVDALDPNTKTIYEFNGDFWHGNPDIYNQNEINPINHKTFGYLYEKTEEKRKFLEIEGFKVISIWENNFKTNHLA